ncbi:hypothetical protein GGR42_001599 [Saonia flava]|uniref:Uncharacterized protein n=2 Tax=Saonia flava TaxID=523696 RepID=A0A846QV87_9FLAO|nr:hypothetical protein [Saonia flava]
MPETLSGRYVHNIVDCDTSGNPEENCSEFLEFIDETKVDVLYGGGDIIRRFNYSIENFTLTLEQEPTSSFLLPFGFNIIDETTLERTDNGDVWKKQ